MVIVSLYADVFSHALQRTSNGSSFGVKLLSDNKTVVDSGSMADFLDLTQL